MKIPVLILGAILMGSLPVHADDQADRDWADQQAKYLALAREKYAKEMEDPAFTDAVQREQEYAEKSGDAIFKSPDWPLKLAERVYKRVYGPRPAPIAAAVAPVQAEAAIAQTATAQTPRVISPMAVKIYWAQISPELRQSVILGQFDLAAEDFAYRYNYKQCLNAGDQVHAEEWAEQIRYVELLQNARAANAAQVDQQKAALLTQQWSALQRQALERLRGSSQNQLLQDTLRAVVQQAITNYQR